MDQKHSQIWMLFPDRQKFKQLFLKFLNFFVVVYSWTLNIIGPFAKKLEYLLFLENLVMGQSFFHLSQLESTHFIRAHSCIT